MRRSDIYQIALVCSGVVATALFGVFFYRELFPEYRIYQDDYVALEQFRASYTGEEPPPFKKEVKQIVIESDNNGPPVIDRCISCHVALQVEAFSPTKISRDINGNIIVDKNGIPVKTENEEYIWNKLDEKIAELTDEKVNNQLVQQGEKSKVNDRLKEAEDLKKLKTAHVGEYTYDVTKVLAMHPLIGKETRPFEFHPVEDYGCVSCHSGNGRGLTTDKAHGPVFDGQYETEFMGPKPTFLESDPKNDPQFAHIFNDKPGHSLLFQTTPILVGSLIQAKCVQCHQSSIETINNANGSTTFILNKKNQTIKALKEGIAQDKNAIISNLLIQNEIVKKGLVATLAEIQKQSENYNLPQKEQDELATQYKSIINIVGQLPQNSSKEAINSKQQLLTTKLDNQLKELIGSDAAVTALKNKTKNKNKNEIVGLVDKFIESETKDNQSGLIFSKIYSLESEKNQLSLLNSPQQNFHTELNTDVDVLTKDYRQGQSLFVSQACYACHRINALSRGGVGPELTRIGTGYPWYIKEKIMWPQGDLKTSTMPNFRLDHEELEDIVTFLLGQNGETKAVSDTGYHAAIQEWESGRFKQDWEKPITPAQVHDLRYSMTVFATEGCASCHRLKGFESNVGYKVEKDSNVSFPEVYKESEWFQTLFPSTIIGSEIVEALDKHAKEIDNRIVDKVRENSLLEEIDKNHPDTIESFYSNFKFANRAKNAYYEDKIAQARTDKEKDQFKNELNEWKDRVRRVLMVFIQEYGLGRLIGPQPNWSGIYRSDEWLMEHFHNPSGHVARSIMPIFPFDESKFYALTYMLDTLAPKNSEAIRKIWNLNGFDPELAVNIFCAQCHGELLRGNGPVSDWIYPIPKNLRDALFLRNLTRERVVQSITHGVKGTPMPPWGEVAEDKSLINNKTTKPVLTESEIERIADWLFTSLPLGRVIESSEEVMKWNYTPQDVIDELNSEQREILPEFHPKKTKENPQNSEFSSDWNPSVEEFYALESNMTQYDGYYASLGLVVPEPDDLGTTQDIVPKKPIFGVDDLFDVRAAPVPGIEDKGYYIKKSFYTPENISAGQKFFELNCAACHGKEGDGTGMRAGIMLDAKPRMLINLDWINSRDDLRLLRSIKYGVPGTAMTPWGDLTSSLQRIQLVVFIRSLNDEREKRDALTTGLYKSFEIPQIEIENERVENYKEIQKLQNELEITQKEADITTKKIQSGEGSAEEGVKIYQKIIDISTKLKPLKAKDQTYIDLKDALKQEYDLYLNLGTSLITQHQTDSTLNTFNELVSLNEVRFTVKDEKLNVKPITEETVQKRKQLVKQITNDIDNQIKELQLNAQKKEKEDDSDEKTNAINELTSEITSLNKLKQKFLTDYEQTLRLEKKQEELIKIF